MGNTDTIDAELNTLYSKMMEESYDYNKELSEKVINFGGETASDTIVPGKIYHTWMDSEQHLRVTTGNLH